MTLYEGNGIFGKKLYDQQIVLKKNTKQINEEESNIMNVLEKINLNTQFRLRKNCEYTLVLRNKTQEQEDEDSLK